MDKQIDIMALAERLIDNLNRLETKSIEESIYYRGAKAGVVELIKIIKNAASGEGNDSGQSGPAILQRDINGALSQPREERGGSNTDEAPSNGETANI